MWRDALRLPVLAMAIMLAAAACGGNGSGEGGDGPGEGGDGSGEGMTITRLCDPIEDEVLALTGAGAQAEHNDIYADSAEPILDCRWRDDDTDWEIGVGYNGLPSDFMVGLTEGKHDLAEVDAPNAYAKSRLDIRAPNGWTITVYNYGADAPDDPEALATIGNAALDLIGS